jgi:hypothetical protein
MLAIAEWRGLGFDSIPNPPCIGMLCSQHMDDRLKNKKRPQPLFARNQCATLSR